MKISIIIPAYNVEKYIESCLTSVVRQDLPFSDYEIVVLNDGSTDSTYSKILNFAKDYPNIVVINKANEGLGTTRNRGLDEARGEYVMFLDSDDTIIENCLSSIYSHLKNDDLDILEFNFSHIDEEGLEVVPKIYADGNYQHPLNTVISGRDNLLYSDNFIPMVPMHAFRRELLTKNNIYMINEKHEDENFTPRAYCLAQRVKSIDTIIYMYLKRGGSIMTSYNPKNIFDGIISIGLLKKFIVENVPESDVELHDFFLRRFAKIISLVFRRSFTAGIKVQRELIREMKKYDVYPFHPKRDRVAKMIFNSSAILFCIYFIIDRELIRKMKNDEN